MSYITGLYKPIQNPSVFQKAIHYYHTETDLDSKNYATLKY